MHVSRMPQCGGTAADSQITDSQAMNQSEEKGSPEDVPLQQTSRSLLQ